MIADLYCVAWSMRKGAEASHKYYTWSRPVYQRPAHKWHMLTWEEQLRLSAAAGSKQQGPYLTSPSEP